MEDIQQLAERLIANIEKVIIGKTEAVRLTVLGLLIGPCLSRSDPGDRCHEDHSGIDSQNSGPRW